MNTNVTSEIELALRKQVERAVRPLRASEGTKLRIRQELLAHVTEIYFEERSQKCSDPAALEKALARFGAPTELTAEFARSLPRSETLAWWQERYESQLDRIFSKQEGESVARWVVRAILVITTLTALLFTAVGAFAWATGGPDDPTTHTLLARLFPLVVVSQCAAVFAAVTVERLAARRQGLARWLGVAAHSVAWSVVLLVSLSLFWWSIAQRTLSSTELGRLTITVGLTVAGVLVVVALASDLSRSRKQTYDAWRLLEID